MRILFIPLVMLCLALPVSAQERYFTKSGQIVFFSSTSIEDIRAVNDQVTSYLDIKTGELVFSVLIRSFTFDKALMQEHFNENYVESDKYPKATFEGRIIDFAPLDVSKSGTVEVKVSGKLAIHGITREIEVSATLSTYPGKITAKSDFYINPEEFGIRIPQVVRKNIAEKIAVNVLMFYIPFKK